MNEQHLCIHDNGTDTHWCECGSDHNHLENGYNFYYKDLAPTEH